MSLLLLFNPRGYRPDDPSGGFSFGGAGSGPVRLQYSLQGNGGWFWGGSTPTQIIRRVQGSTGSGGWMFGGSTPSTSWGIKPTGGWQFGGWQTPLIVKVATPTGGLSFGGDSLLVGVSQYVGGGFLFGGSIPFDTNKGYGSPLGSGGWQFGGSSTIGRGRINEQPTGGFSFGGDSPKYAGSSPRPSGGFSFGGEAMVRGRIVAAPSGGWMFGGSTPAGSAAFAPVTSYDAGSPTGGFYFGGNLTSHRGPTTQPAILKAIRQRLIDTGVLLGSQVFVEVDPLELEKERPASDFIASIIPGRKVVDQGQLEAGGTEADFRVEVVEIRIYARLNTDITGQRTDWATNTTRGAYAKARSVASKFQIHDLADPSGTVLVAQPTRILDIGNPAGQRFGWGFVPVQIEIAYTEEAPS